MSDTLLRALADLPQSVSLATRRGRPQGTLIPNEVMLRYEDHAYLQQAERRSLAPFLGIASFSRGHGPDATYNCVGAVLGSRRTHIDPEHILWILGRDGYHLIEHSDVAVGDVVTWQGEDGAYTHIGVVVGVELAFDTLRIPRVLSKWGQLGEYVHRVADVPVGYGAFVRYWSVRRDT